MRLKLIILAVAVLCGPVTGLGTPAASAAAAAASSEVVAGRYLPLWPFATWHEVRQWQRAHRTAGRQPWHLDPEATAVGFTVGYLGFKQIDRVARTVVDGRHAWVHVAYATQESPEPLVAAVVHLVRWGGGADAPWEVVGTDDSTMSLTTPRYGSAVRSPVKAGGRITGVDESIQVRLLRIGAERPLGKAGPVPAGGERQPWSAKLTFRPVPGHKVATIVAATGGHIADVERFTITGVRLTG